jgi:hypothetical protein
MVEETPGSPTPFSSTVRTRPSHAAQRRVPPVDRSTTPARDATARLDRGVDSPFARSPAVGESESWRSILSFLASYLLGFALLAADWLRVARMELPEDVYRGDGWLIVWVMTWVSRALAFAPTTLFDAPVNVPARGQLTGSEHFAGYQVLFAPLLWSTGDPILAANLTAFAMLPLAALAMMLLCRAYGVGRLPAWLAGLWYGLCYPQVPANLHLLQYAGVWFPACAWALRRLRSKPTWGRAAALAVLYALGSLASYHLAVMLSIVCAIWGVMELVAEEDGRARFAIRASLAAAVAVAVVVAVSAPYLRRPEASGQTDLAGISRWRSDHLWTERTAPSIGDEKAAPPADEHSRPRPAPSAPETEAEEPPLTAALEAVFITTALRCGAGRLLIGSAGLLWIRRRAGAKRRLAIAGIAVAILGVVLAAGPAATVGSWTVSLPFGWLAHTPARFIRVPHRFLNLASFGFGVIVALGLEALLDRFRTRSIGRGVAAATLAAIALFSTTPLGRPLTLSLLMLGRGADPRLAWTVEPPPAVHRVDGDTAATKAPLLRPILASLPFETVAAATTSRSVYESVRAAARKYGDGPLLELPAIEPNPEGMFGSIIHEQPLIQFYTGYEPPHRPMIDRIVAALPQREALDDLVALTGVRWILLRPPAEWRQPRSDFARLLLEHPGVDLRLPLGQFLLFHIGRPKVDAEWAAALAAGPKPGVTLLGTPLAPIDAASAAGNVAIEHVGSAKAGWFVRVTMRVRNTGPATWPAAVPPRATRDLVVEVVARWRRPGGGDAGIESVRLPLPRDVRAGDSVLVSALIATPREAGEYELVAVLDQAGSAGFAAAGTAPAIAPVSVSALDRTRAEHPIPVGPGKPMGALPSRRQAPESSAHEPESPRRPAWRWVVDPW